MSTSSSENALAGVRVEPLNVLRDPRGWFLKVLMAKHLPAGGREFGEIYISTSESGVARGNHFHKKMTEWFTPISGRGELVVCLPEGTERRTIVLDSAAPVRIQVPPNVAHAFRSIVTEPLLLLAYSDMEYDPADTDTYPFTIF